MRRIDFLPPQCGRRTPHWAGPRPRDRPLAILCLPSSHWYNEVLTDCALPIQAGGTAAALAVENRWFPGRKSCCNLRGLYGVFNVASSTGVQAACIGAINGARILHARNACDSTCWLSRVSCNTLQLAISKRRIGFRKAVLTGIAAGSGVRPVNISVRARPPAGRNLSPVVACHCRQQFRTFDPAGPC